MQTIDERPVTAGAPGGGGRWDGQLATVTFEGPRPQRRATVAFRLVLAFPHFVCMGALTAVAFVVVVISWFGALFTGRVPAGIGEFVTRVIQYGGRVQAYANFLLTDRYPPFTLGPAAYPVAVEIVPVARLNRAAVLFRAVLQLPALVLMQLVTWGTGLAGVFVWLVVLVAGRVPDPLFHAQAAILRYEVRVWAYVAMLTSRYPGALFGDPERTVAMPVWNPGAPVEGAAMPPAPGTGGASEPSAAPPRITRLVLRRPAKRLVALFLVIGVVGGVGSTVAGFVAALELDDAALELDDAYLDLNDASVRFAEDVQACAFSGGVACVHDADRRLAAALRTFRADLRAIELPEHALVAAHDVDESVLAMLSILDEMAATEDGDRYQELARRFTDAGARFDADVQALYDQLLF